MALDVTGRFRYPNPDPTWLARHTEPVLAADLPIVDSHHHLWDEPGKRYLGDDFLADSTSGHNIRATVCIEAHFGYYEDGPPHLRCVGETARIEDIRVALNERQPRLGACAGIVGFADLTTVPERLGETLDAHAEASPHFKGIRQSVARDSHFPDGIVLRPAPAGMLSDPAFRRGVRMLGRRELTVDLLLYHQQIPELTALARSVNDASIVLDHIGCPIGVGPYRNHERETFEAWRVGIAELSTCQNVVVKFGGFGMVIFGSEYNLEERPPTSARLADAWRPYFDICMNTFGPRRMMFESNFPVDKAMYSYVTVWNAFKRLSADLSLAERMALFSGSAISAYRLDFDHRAG